MKDKNQIRNATDKMAQFGQRNTMSCTAQQTSIFTHEFKPIHSLATVTGKTKETGQGAEV